MLGAGREVVGRKEAFGMEVAGVLGTQDTPVVASKWKVETQSPPSLLYPTPTLCQARLRPVLLHCIPLIPQPSQPSWGIDWVGGSCGEHRGA